MSEQSEKIADTLDQLLNDVYWGDIKRLANDAVELIKAKTGIRHTYLWDWREIKGNLWAAVNEVCVAHVSRFDSWWDRVLRVSKHSNDGLQGNLSEFKTWEELMRYLMVEAIIGDVHDEIEVVRNADLDAWDKQRAAQLRDAGWLDHEAHGDSWISPSGIVVYGIDEAYDAWKAGFVMVEDYNGKAKVEV